MSFRAFLPPSNALKSILSNTRAKKWPAVRLKPHFTVSRPVVTSLLPAFTLEPSSHEPSFALAIGVIVGLPLALWVYKCVMMVAFQRKIIYMGYLPPGVRAQKLDPAEVSGGFSCVTNTIPSQPGVVLSGITMQRAETREPNIVVLYLQGNAGNPLGRIPVFAALLKAWSSRPIGHTISAHPHSVPDGTRSTLAHPQISVVAFAPRSYWSSTRRTPTQAGLLADYRIALDYTLATYPRARIVLYGHSLGGAIATCLLSTLPDRMSEEKTSPSLAASSSEVDMISIPSDSEYARVAGVILENPFASIPGMVQALYRSRWTPYRYLAPLVWDKWDASDAMRRASVPGGNGSVLARLRPRVRVMVSEYDEVVPRTMGEGLAELAGVVGAVAEGIGGYDIDGKTSIGGLTVLRGAMHEDGWQKRQWTMQMKEYLDEVARREDNCTPS